MFVFFCYHWRYPTPANKGFIIGFLHLHARTCYSPVTTLCWCQWAMAGRRYALYWVPSTFCVAMCVDECRSDKQWLLLMLAINKSKELTGVSGAFLYCLILLTGPLMRLSYRVSIGFFYKLEACQSWAMTISRLCPQKYSFAVFYSCWCRIDQFCAFHYCHLLLSLTAKAHFTTLIRITVAVLINPPACGHSGGIRGFKHSISHTLNVLEYATTQTTACDKQTNCCEVL